MNTFDRLVQNITLLILILIAVRYFTGTTNVLGALFGGSTSLIAQLQGASLGYAK